MTKFYSKFHFLTLFLLLCCIPTFITAQTTVQIGTGTAVSGSTLYSPIYRFDASSATSDTKSNILFTATELSTARIANGDLITAIAFNKANTGYFLIPVQYTIRMGNTANAPPLAGTIATQWPTILATQTTVYTSSSFNVPNTAGWVTITLTTPFIYTGGSLEISTEVLMTGGTTGASDKISWEYTTGFSDYIIGE